MSFQILSIGLSWGLYGGRKWSENWGSSLLAPFLVQKRVMVFSIIANHNDSSRGARADLTQQFEKLPKCLGVENLLLSLGKQLAVAQAHRSEIAHAFACRSMKQHWILYFGWYPHPTARTHAVGNEPHPGPKDQR